MTTSAAKDSLAEYGAAHIMNITSSADLSDESGDRVILDTRNRGKGADRWILHLQGKKHIQPLP
ncbi:MAG: hypothetical protein KAH09_01100 [Desulfobacula sp.]|nr:hypothetical protein [Desulfobacula sp.]